MTQVPLRSPNLGGAGCSDTEPALTAPMLQSKLAQSQICGGVVIWKLLRLESAEIHRVRSRISERPRDPEGDRLPFACSALSGRKPTAVGSRMCCRRPGLTTCACPQLASQLVLTDWSETVMGTDGVLLELRPADAVRRQVDCRVAGAAGGDRQPDQTMTIAGLRSLRRSRFDIGSPPRLVGARAASGVIAQSSLRTRNRLKVYECVN